ncbi:hypothetical protein QUF58_10360 [Anaerolineales bacterium HSG24]|nr:hypothetical protein [Anaerolineales bacterium HSG24]
MRSRTPGYFLRIRIVIVGLFILLAIALYVARTIPPPAVPEFTPPPPPTETSTPLPEISPTLAKNETPTPAPTSTPIIDTISYNIAPEVNYVGWMQSDEMGNHFGESYLYTGLRNATLHHGAFQFDLSAIPPNSEIMRAEIELTGLTTETVSTQFQLNILANIDSRWPLYSFEDIHNADIELLPKPLIIDGEELGLEQVNLFEFNASVRSIVEERLGIGRISFRLDSLTPDQEGLFGWDSGYGADTLGNAPILKLEVRLPNMLATRQIRQTLEAGGDLNTPTPPPIGKLVIVTNTPTPENVITAIAIQMTATYEYELLGEPTPTPNSWVTPWVLIPTSTPENQATARFARVEATVLATMYGTPTLLPINAITMTPTPPYYIITSTPTPETILTAAFQTKLITAQAIQFGPATPLPDNWVTPLVVTSTPTPVNETTALYLEAILVTTGTPTPMPDNAQTATSTAIYQILDGELPPLSPTPTPTFTPGPIPASLIGMIAFKSDRTYQETVINPQTGAEEIVFDQDDPGEIFIINPDGTGLALLSDRWPYDLAQEAEEYSIDGRFRVFTKDVIRYQKIETDSGKTEMVFDPDTEQYVVKSVPSISYIRVDAPGLYWYDYHYEVEEQVTRFGAGIAYGGVWSPTREQIAFISTESANDEIWVVNRDGLELRQLTRDRYHWWDKHPSWSPDGNQIVFWSNRTGHGQIWIMDRDGSNLRSISRTGFNDWDPIWIKTLGVPQYEKN